MSKVYIKVGNKYIAERDHSHLVETEIPDQECEFKDSEADQIIKYLGEGKKVQINEDQDHK